MLFDLLRTSTVLRNHVASGAIVFGINESLNDFRRDRKKRLDLVVARPRTGGSQKRKPHSLTGLVEKYRISLTDADRAELDALPVFMEGPVGSVQIALEAKACMTEFAKARPRLFDELTSSQQTVNGAAGDAVAAAFVMINAAEKFVSPLRNKRPLKKRAPVVSIHDQPLVKAESVIQRIRAILRRSRAGDDGFDGIGIVVVECRNDRSPIRLFNSPPAPDPADIYNYEMMIRRLTQAYETRFRAV